MAREDIDKHLLEHTYPLECENLPFDQLGAEEQRLVLKCVEHEDFSEEELKDLKKLLMQYRAVSKKYNIKEVEKNIETQENIIRTQSDLLRLLHDENRFLISMNYWINDKKYLLKMRIKPFTDKQYLEGLGEQLGLFRDLSIDDKKLINKANQQQLTPEEAKLHQAIMDRINKKLEESDSQVEMMTKFLADRLNFIDDEELPFEEKYAFWKTVELNYRFALFNKVRSVLHLNDTFEEELFPSTG